MKTLVKVNDSYKLEKKGKNMNTRIIYYASSYLTKDYKKQSRYIKVPDTVQKGDFVIIEKEDNGIFIGIIDDPIDIVPDFGYTYVQNIDLSAYLKDQENKKRKEALRIKMEERFAEIDKEKKYQYYADLDPDFKAMFEEYKNL